ncbi:hypothetical protein FQ192_32520 [Pseudomonas sp. ANT_J12]|uniref:hypothetical protein n=1 Tax=unclassified Pseudomonas TaxID=196821 RepID=UPI0010110F0F|nr:MULTISPECIES: hypothetical protein [unclassified Pseudomonas]KAA0982054.1 hypothetical protein FQ192_32520 [Pseudomonas sp. ANT_J12]QAY91480.1 hypothetical protein CUN63_16785 [Pseudomonas sp. ACM7]
MKQRTTGKGLIVCEEALQRLVVGKPFLAEHVGLPLSKLTAGAVSREAGFDPGYLKKSRKLHLPLIAKIQSLREESSNNPKSSNADRVAYLEAKLAVIEVRLVKANELCDKVLTQNLQLWERVRKLEAGVGHVYRIN